MPYKKKKEKEKCKYETKFYKCSRVALPGDEHCVFHSKDIEGKKEKFNDAFWKEFERQKEYEEIFDFNGFIFPDISFIVKEFEKGAKFYEAQFSGRAFFTEAKFSGEVSFWGVKFLGEADFNRAEFSKNANFERITIEKFSSFEMIDTYFYNVSGLFEFIERNDKVFKKLRNRSWTLKTEFLPKNLKLILLGTANDKVFKKLRKKLRNRSWPLKTEFLPKNFKLILGDRVTARYPVQSRQTQDDMYLLDKKERISKMKGIRKFRDGTLYFLWWLFADYGRSFKRWALWSLGLALTFAVVFYLYFLESPSSFQTVYISEGCPFFSFFYYSVVTFTTLGFGDIVPKCGWLQMWVMLEVILGYIMLGGLISILANKLARRS